MNSPSMHKHCGAAFIAIALGVCALPQARAQAGAAAPSSGFYAFGGFAKLFAERNSQLTGERGSPVNLIAGGGYRLTPGLAVELNLLFALRETDTPSTAQPPAGTYMAGTLESGMGTVGHSATVKYNFAVRRFAPYFGGGVGTYRTTFLTTSEAPGCTQNCDNTGPEVRASSRDIGIHALAGVDYHFTPRHVLSGEIRYLKLKADFGAIVPGEVNVGGTFLWVGYRRNF